MLQSAIGEADGVAADVSRQLDMLNASAGTSPLTNSSPSPATSMPSSGPLTGGASSAGFNDPMVRMAIGALMMALMAFMMTQGNSAIAPMVMSLMGAVMGLMSSGGGSALLNQQPQPGAQSNASASGLASSSTNPFQLNSAPASQASGQTSQTGDVLANAATQIASSMGGTKSTGYCYRGVANALDKIGVNVHGRSAYMAADQLANNSKMKEIQVSCPTKAPRGAIIVWDKGNGHEHGHIEVALGNGQAASDYQGSIMTQSRYGTSFRVFVPADMATA